MKLKKYDVMEAKIFPNREEMGKAAAKDAAACLKDLLAKKGEVNCIFAAAPSQNDMIMHLIAEPGIDWTRVNAFHMDEYIDIPQGEEGSFSCFLKKAIFDKLPFKNVYLLDGMASASSECDRYAALLKQFPTDITFLGIGENGHLAFNDPPVADFKDKSLVKVVELDHACRVQQANDASDIFPTLDDVPKIAITLTIPALLKASRLFCVVPGERKAQAVKDALIGPVNESCPASILRQTHGATLYIDEAAAALLPE